MSSANVIVPPDISKLIIEREKLWLEFDRARGLATELSQVASQIPNCTPAELQLQFGADSIPPAEVASVLGLVKEKISAVDRLKADMQSRHDEIASIKQKQKTVIVSLAVGGAVVLLILLIVMISVISQLSS
jgi:hypothetical protein